MLLGFGGRNFYSFKEDFDVSLEHKGDGLSILGIKGANASGKTNAIKALSYIRAFMFDSFSQFQPEDGMLANPFFDNQNNIELYIHFKIENIEYKYEIEFTKDQLKKELLSRRDNRWNPIVTREGDNLTKCIKELDELKTINFNRTNVSIISLAHQYGLTALTNFYNFAENIASNVNIQGKMTNNDHFMDYREISKVYFDNPRLTNAVVMFLKKADTGISAIEIIKSEDKITKKLIYEPLFHHKVDDKVYKLQYIEESNGTRLLYRQLGTYLTVLELGSIVAYDEFDIGLHPDLSLMIIDLFENKELNKNGAQLILTSHHSEVIDKLGKYRLVFVNKKDNESYLYRLDEIPGDILRPDRSIMPAYNSRKIGGRPEVVTYG